MQHDAGPVVVLVEADQLARHAEEFQGSPRHAAERVVAALIGPAAFAVAGDAVRKAAVAVLPQVERRGLRRIDLVTESGGGAGGPFGPDGGRERIGFPFQLGAGERRERAESCFKLRFAAGADYRAVLRFEQQERPAVPHRKRPVADQIRGGASGRERELDELRVAVPVEQVKQRRAAALRGVRFDIDREIPLRMADKIERRTDAVPLKRGAEQRSERVILKLRRKYVDGALAELADGEGRRVSARAEHLPIAGEFHPDRVASGKPAGQGCRAGDGERDFFEPGIFVFFERKSGEESGGVGRAAVFVLGHEFAPGDEDAACFDETPQRLRGTRQRIPDADGDDRFVSTEPAFGQLLLKHRVEGTVREGERSGGRRDLVPGRNRHGAGHAFGRLRKQNRRFTRNVPAARREVFGETEDLLFGVHDRPEVGGGIGVRVQDHPWELFGDAPAALFASGRFPVPGPGIPYWRR